MSGDEQPSATELERGTAYGRYTILGQVGEGSMGVVYAAYDPRLDRRVALKLVRSNDAQGPNPDDLARLLREAKAMARLSHPNVVAAHDAGEIDGQLHLAMEYVEGETLRKWMSDRSHSMRQVLDVFAQAGKGLAAAHHAGMVHRDFKPENVLVDRSGRVRVTDFGLARASGVVNRAAQLASAEEPNPLSALTATGAMMGTPSYMAPELFTGRPADSRTDQFAFCVALYEALHGERPFGGETLEALAFAVTMGKVRPAPREARVPAWLRRVLLRGLAVDPNERFASMDLLLDSLARDPAARRRGWAGATLLALLGVATSVAFALVRSRDDQTCRGGEKRMAGVWDEGRKDQARRAFLATALPFAEDAWRGAEASLSTYASSWLVMFRDTCEATQLRHEQSEALLDLRMACLNRRLEELAALGQLFASADAKVIENAGRAAAAQTPLATCADAVALSPRGRLPADPELRRKVEVLQADLARVKALTDAGKLMEALPRAEEAARAARALGHVATLAEALVALALVHQRLEQSQEAEAVLEEAVPAALESHHDAMFAIALVRLVFLVGVSQSRVAEGVRWGKFAQGAVAALRPGDREPIEASRLGNMGALATAQGDNAEATRLDELALELRERALGPFHFDTAMSLNNLAADHYAVGDYAGSARFCRRAAEAFEKAVGASHPYVASALSCEGAALMESGDSEDALRLDRRALGILEAAGGPDQVLVGDVLVNQGSALMRLGRLDEALGTTERALAIFQRRLGAKDYYVAVVLNNLAEIRRRRREYAQAVDLARRSSSMFSELLGPKNPSVSSPLIAEAEAWLAAGKPDRALDPAERALTIRDGTKMSLREKAEARFVVARALTASGRSRARALDLARGALDLFARQGKGYEDVAKKVADWVRLTAGAPPIPAP